MTTEEPAQIASPAAEEFDDMILLSDHNQIVKDLKEEYEVKITHLNGVNAKLEAWGNGFQVKLASTSQELYRLKNLYPDLANIYKGVMKWGPDSFKNAMMLLAFLWSAHQTVFGMWKKANEKPKRPIWHYAMLGMIFIVVGGGWFAYLSNPAQAGAGVAAAAPYLAIFAVAMLIAFVMLRRKKERKANTP